MGQSSSTQRDQRHNSLANHSNSPQEQRDRLHRHDVMNGQRNTEQAGDAGAHPGSGMSNGEFPGYPANQTDSTASTWPSTDIPASEQATGTTENGSHYESGRREYRSPVFARMAARRQSTMSRLGSRILPNSVIRGLLSSEEETPAEGHAHRHGIVSRSIPRSEVAQGSSRFNPLASLGSSGISRRRMRGPYFIPRSDPGLGPDAGATEHGPDSTRGSWRRSARLHRVRNSLSTPIAQMFGQPSNQPTGNMQEPPLGPLPGPGPFLPHPGPMDTRMDFDEPHELDSVEPAIGTPRTASPISSQSTLGQTRLRQLPSLLRARPSRTLQREEQTPLARVLQLAATAIAAQLSGTTGPAMPNIQSLGNDGLDGSLENFIQSLQHATSAQASPNDTANSPAEGGPSPPVNFLRVFRFANSDGARPGTSTRSSGPESSGSNASGGPPADNPLNGPEGRTVTLVVVGVRSVPPGNGTPSGDQQPNGGHGLDALLHLPFLSPGNLPRNRDSGTTSAPQTEGLPRLATPHRPQGGELNPTPSGEELQQQQQQQPQGIQSPLRRLSDVGSRGPPSSLPSVLSESPPGPHPPPSTPAEPGLSAVSSGASTPSRRPSSASVISPNPLPQLDENRPMQPTVEPAESSVPFGPAHRRHRSDSEFARHRDLGSGAVRRNGVVEPDNAPAPAGRSWLIYVVGTNLSENHPAFATPSLFTDNPTYEDMILLSSLLGPVKPPVASQQDLHSAGGLFRLVEYAGALVAESTDGAGTILIPEGDRCLICLSDYEVSEQLRQLTQCRHVFHQDCIDQWLTTGRNSCPLCRGQGVTENPNAGPTPGAQNNATAF